MIRAYFLNHTVNDVTLLSKLYTEVCLRVVTSTMKQMVVPAWRQAMAV